MQTVGKVNKVNYMCLRVCVSVKCVRKRNAFETWRRKGKTRNKLLICWSVIKLQNFFFRKKNALNSIRIQIQISHSGQSYINPCIHVYTYVCICKYEIAYWLPANRSQRWGRKSAVKVIGRTVKHPQRESSNNWIRKMQHSTIQ